MTKQSQAIWEERVRKWRQSGLAAEEFAEGKGYKGSSLRWAESRLRGTPQCRRGQAARAEVEDAGLETAPRFAPLRARPSEPTGELVLESGAARIHVGTGFSVALLGEVIRALGESGR